MRRRWVRLAGCVLVGARDVGTLSVYYLSAYLCIWMGILKGHQSRYIATSRAGVWVNGTSLLGSRAAAVGRGRCVGMVIIDVEFGFFLIRYIYLLRLCSPALL